MDFAFFNEVQLHNRPSPYRNLFTRFAWKTDPVLDMIYEVEDDHHIYPAESAIFDQLSLLFTPSRPR